MKQDALWIAAAVDGTLQGENIAVTGSVQTDSRRCDPGSLYVARVGESADGHDFVLAAQERGAVCAIVERQLPLDLPQIVVEDATLALGQLAKAHLAYLRELGTDPLGTDVFPHVIGITGSVGKTTTKDLLGQLLSLRGPTVYSELSFNNEVGCPLTILRADVDTRFLVLEMGASAPGHIRYLTEIAPLNLAVVLNVGSAHLEGFGTIENLARAKMEILQGLAPGGGCLLNIDDPWICWMAGQIDKETILSFSPAGDSRAVFWATEATLNDRGELGFRYCQRYLKRLWMDVPLVGAHQVTNALAAVVAAFIGGPMPLENIQEGLANARRLSPHRMDVRSGLSFGEASEVQVIDDSYNANLDSMAAGLRAASTLAGEGRLVAVLGEMLELGEKSPELHAEVGRIAASVGVDVLLGIGAQIPVLVAAADAGGVETYSYPGYQEVLRVLPEMIHSGDTILLKGSLGSEVWRIADSLLETSQDK